MSKTIRHVSEKKDMWVKNKTSEWKNMTSVWKIRQVCGKIREVCEKWDKWVKK